MDTPFDLASVTKLFTSVAAMQQIERGTLGIDAKVGAYLPDFRAAARHGITVRQLLTHTSGLRPELPLYDCADDTERLSMLRTEAPVGEQGEYVYSDLNLLLLQFVLERVTGRTLDVLIHDGITRPLGMTSTDFGPSPARRRQRTSAALGQGRPRHAPGRRPRRERLGAGWRGYHAGLFSTGRDLAIFCRTLLAGGSYGPARILGSDYVELLLTPPGLGFGVDQAWFMGSWRVGGGGAHRVHGDFGGA